MKKKLKDRVKHMGIALWLLMNEKTFRRNDTRLKYLFYKGNSDVLIVSFSAYNKEKALYNYIRTLKNIDASKLYIKDDFSKNKKGSYYLGEKGKHNVEGTVCELIQHYVEKLGFNNESRLIFVGSSKGGYAAINFGLEFDNSYIISGAPQYFLGTHLNEPYFYDMLEDIVGERTEANIQSLDNHIRNKIQKLHHNSHVFLQYSNKEPIYETQIKHLVEDLSNSDIKCEFCELDYPEHADVHKYFPQYLHDSIMSIINSRNE